MAGLPAHTRHKGPLLSDYNQSLAAGLCKVQANSR